jgi:hypothetical protein
MTKTSKVRTSYMGKCTAISAMDLTDLRRVKRFTPKMDAKTDAKMDKICENRIFADYNSEKNFVQRRQNGQNLQKLDFCRL